MDLFQKFASQIDKNITALTATHSMVQTDLSGDALWDLYLASFPEGTNPIFRERTEHDGSYDRSFIRHYGSLKAIHPRTHKVTTLWEGISGCDFYDDVAAALHKAVMDSSITGSFFTKERFWGHNPNKEASSGITFHHFHGIPAPQVIRSNPYEEMGQLNTSRGVFVRGLETLKIEALDTVLSLISENNLYRGDQFAHSVSSFRKKVAEYNDLNEEQKKVYPYLSAPDTFRNTAIGTLVQDLSEGYDLEDAVKSFERKVAGDNYRRPKALVTQKMIDDASAKLTELGLLYSLDRRHATIEDVAVTDVLWASADAQQAMKQGLSALIEPTVHKASKKHSGASSEVSIQDFLKDILPGAKEVKIRFDNALQSNLMNITAPVYQDSPLLFAWDNPFAWSYKGNTADSITERVKRAGGNVEGALRVSLGWFNADDLDLHCVKPNGDEIYFGNKAGILDVDMNAGSPDNSIDPVENMVWKKIPRDGTYRFFVRQFSKRSDLNVGFDIEVHVDGKVHSGSYSHIARGNIDAVNITIKNGAVTDIKFGSNMVQNARSIDSWGISTNTEVNVTSVMLSPNRWGSSVHGQAHFFFTVKDAHNPDPVRGFYNEYLRNDLSKYSKVFELLGIRKQIEPAQNQLAGFGFSSTVRKSVQFIVDKRPYTVNF